VEESSQNSRPKYHQNGDIHSTNLNQESLNSTSNNRLPSPSKPNKSKYILSFSFSFAADDSSGMSFSSTSSKESSADRNGGVLHSSLSEPGKHQTRTKSWRSIK
jgi:hypothetical protein